MSHGHATVLKNDPKLSLHAYLYLLVAAGRHHTKIDNNERTLTCSKMSSDNCSKFGVRLNSDDSSHSNLE